MVVPMALRIHHAAAMPEGGAPSTPVRMRIVGIENEPAAFHLGVAQLDAPPACHLALVEGQIHMLGSIAIQIIDAEGAVAARKGSCGKRVRPAARPAPPIAASGLVA